MKYKPGDYAVILFDEVGSKIRTIGELSSFTEAEAIANELVSHSYAISRIIKNSKFHNANWMPKNNSEL